MTTSINSKYYHQPMDDKTPTSTKGEIFHHIKELFNQERFKIGIVKLVRSVLGLADKSKGTSDFKGTISTLGLVTDVIQVLNIPKTIGDFQTNKGNSLKQAALSFKLLDQTLTIGKILGFFGAVDLGIVAGTLGKIPTIGAGAAKAFSFGNITLIASAIESSLDIALSVRAIKASKKAIGHTLDKKTFWKTVNPAQAADARIAKGMEKKQKADVSMQEAQKRVNEAEEKLKQCEEKESALQSKIQSASHTGKKFLLKLKHSFAKRSLERAFRRHAQEAQKKESAQEKVTKLETRIKSWTRLKSESPTTFQTLKDRKIEKWDLKEAIQKRKIKDEKVGIGINAMIVAICVAVLAITTITIISVSFLAWPITLLGLAISVGATGFAIWRQCRKQPTYKSVPLSKLWESRA